MIEILWNGRGGQGAFTAAKLLGAAFALKDKNSYALAFPSFGPERRGAPIRAFTKLDTKPISDRSEIKESDYIIYLDDTLFSSGALSGLKETGKVILNTAKTYADARVITIDASRIANEIINLPVTNTAMLGALAAVHTDISPAEIEKAIELTMPARLREGNKAVVRAAIEALSKGGFA